MTRISERSLQLLQGKSEEYIAIWLAQGFLNFVRGAPGDPFAPHSFVHLAYHPVEGIEALYSQAPMSVKAGLRKGISMLGPLCQPNSPDSEDLSKTQRLSLLEEFLRLCVSTTCFEAARSIALIACGAGEYWGSEWFRETVYPLCVKGIEDMALGFCSTAFSAIDASAPNEIEAALRRVTYAPAFKAQYAPRMLAALISVTPSNFVEHLRLLSAPMAAMHRYDPMEREVAYKTAHRLVDFALEQLRDHFTKLDIAKPQSPDRWLLDALFDAAGPLRYYRESESAIVVFPANQKAIKMLFMHPDLSRVPLPPATLPPADAAHRAREILSVSEKRLSDYFDASNKVSYVFSPSQLRH
jgi:hypothetical protein